MAKKYKYILISSVIACFFMYYVEQVMKVDYLTKTIAKIVVFTIIPYIYIRLYKKSNIITSLRCKETNKNNIKIGIILGSISFIVILVTYFILKDVINLQSISQELQNKSKVTPVNFLFVAAYITFGNSFLEEFFFRGFIFLNLYEINHKKTAYVFSSLFFALYHMAIFKTWFDIKLILLALFGLITIGFVFDYIDTKSKNFFNSWIVHILADAAIMLIGMRMFGII
ncbi:CPBP family intramembrane glutamic endopeptidase [Clostridium sp. KNHs214]|uniref:CPBP family intramembrane glutamic endopeptidase n=1 Tax=Clostridium sp. KNHs214 TaxID=1540257 RepID=UPI00068FEA03|nr:CPBP family intramembrane glutamic endopeptidase [Clostridium sp. KNHs214]